MGRPKVKIIDDSQVEEIKEKPSKDKRERVKSETAEAISPVETSKEETRGDGEEGSRRVAAVSEANEDARRKTEPAGPRAAQKSQKPGKAKPRGKKYQEITKDLDRTKSYPLNEAIETVKKLSYSKFNATLEAHINTSQTGIRGLVSLPFAAGRKLRILAFGKGADTSGADIIGSEEIIEEINKGKVNFDLVVTTPEWMPKLAKVARILGPRGIMPNPKNGTITSDLKKAVEGFQAGKTEYKTEPKSAVIHLGLGKLDQSTEELSANVKTLLQTLGKTRIKKVT